MPIHYEVSYFDVTLVPVAEKSWHFHHVRDSQHLIDRP